MVIMNYKGGQLANRLYLFSHFIVNSIEHTYQLYNPEFDEYCPFFEATSTNNFQGYSVSTTIFKNHLADRIFSRLFRLWADITHKLFTRTSWYILYRIFNTNDKKNTNFLLNDPKFIQEAKNKNVIVEGWTFRDHANLSTHDELIRKFFTPIEKYRNEVAEEIASARKGIDIIIGVHIRRGDYIRYNGGCWYYSDEVYADKMMQIEQQMKKKGKSCAFFICSNEEINKNNFPDTLKLFTAKRHFITDLYSMASCDGIIGPPSTFSQWASFYGKVPICFIFSKDDAIKLGEYVHVNNP
jgi:hypothetical protein